MKVLKQAREMAATAQALRRVGKSVGFVPTMGALHDGHCSLIRAAHRHTQVVVVSVFVNPLQFGPSEDFASYPRDLKHDLNLSKAAGADLVFAPDASQMYPSTFATQIEVGGLSERFEGAARPGHFRGVATVVTKLLLLVQPTVAYVGQKDYQQALIIQRLVSDLNIPVAIRMMPTVRETDGLAMSSRNVYLSDEARRQAPVLYQALMSAKRESRRGAREVEPLVDQMRALIAQQPLARIDYVAIADAKTLESLVTVHRRAVILAAAWIGATRLIDNLLVDVS